MFSSYFTCAGLRPSAPAFMSSSMVEELEYVDRSVLMSVLIPMSQVAAIASLSAGTSIIA